MGIIENMSFFIGDDGKKYEIFRHGGGNKLAQEYKVPFLGEIPIDPKVAESGDEGKPIVLKHPENPVSKAYMALAQTVIKELGSMDSPRELPKLEM